MALWNGEFVLSCSGCVAAYLGDAPVIAAALGGFLNITGPIVSHDYNGQLIEDKLKLAKLVGAEYFMKYQISDEFEFAHIIFTER